MKLTSHLFKITLVACLAAFSSAANAQQDRDEKELDMVYIGAYWMQRAATHFSQQASEELGAKVNFWLRSHGGLVSIATEKLAAGGHWDIVDDADIVFVMMTGNFDHQEGFCLDTPGQNPFGDTPESLRADAEAFVAELVSNVDSAKTMVRIGLPAVTPYFRSLWVERGTLEECSNAWLDLLKQWRDIGAEYDIPVVDVTRAWNGSDAITPSPDVYFVTDRTHLNEQGALAVAELIHAVGYAPLR